MYIKNKAEPKQHSIAEARSSLPGLVREAESGAAVALTRRGEFVAVLIGRREYERLTSSGRKFSAVYAEFRRKLDLGALGLDPDDVFAGAREPVHGRRVDL